MRPIYGVSPLLSAALLFTTPGLAVAVPGGNPHSLPALIADVAEANQKLSDLGAAVQAKQESVNKAILDVQTARDNVVTAQRDLEASQKAVSAADSAIADAQHRFDVFAASTYTNGPSSSLLMASSPEDILASASASQTLTNSASQAMADLQQARTTQLNNESAARLAKQKADQAVADAQHSQDSAVASLTDAQHTFADQQKQIDTLAAERDSAKAKLAEAQAMSAPTGAGSAPVAKAAKPGGAQGATPDWDRKPGAAPGAPPYGDASEWDMTLPMIPSAFVSGDPIQIINAVLLIAQTSLQVTADLGKKFMQSIGLLPTDTGLNTAATITTVHGAQASEYVINRALAQRGVPYSWGGGNAAGPSNGIDSGSGTVGFDCSGLSLYAFAGVGIKLTHYSGSQYNMGGKIPSSEMRRGDVIFYGPGGSQHVTLYLGNGQMLEAPYTGSVVKVSPVRTSGMTPYVVRYIEY